MYISNWSVFQYDTREFLLSLTCTTDIGYSYQDPKWATTKSKNNKRVGTSIVYIWVDRYKSLTHIQFASDQVC